MIINFQGSKYLYFSAFAANILAFIVGTAATWSSPIIPKLRTSDLTESPLGKQISETEASWIGSLLSVGAIFSSLLFGYMTQKVGRKTTTIIVAVPFLIAFLLTAFADIIELYYVGRILMGLGTGGMFFASPIYLVEIAEDANRGLLTASTSCFLMLGMLVSLSVGPFVSIMAFNLILAFVCVLYFPLYWFLAPETPYFLVRVNKDEEARKSLQYLRRRPHKELEEELEKIKYHLALRKQGSFMHIFTKKGTTKAFVYSLFLVIFQQFAGINVFYSYMQTIFDATKSSIPPEICPIIVSTVQLISSTTSTLLSDRVGRRFLLLISTAGAAVSEIALGVYFYLDKNNKDVSAIGWLPVLSLVVFMLFYKLGVGTLSWPMVSELLPPNIISKAMLPLTSLNWLVSFLMTLYFASLSQAIGMAGSFWLFSGFCVAFGLLIYFFIFETKGRSLKDIQTILNK